MTPAPRTCTWKADDVYGMYETGCGNAFEIIEGDIEENNFKYCPYCGKKIQEQSHDPAAAAATR